MESYSGIETSYQKHCSFQVVTDITKMGLINPKKIGEKICCGLVPTWTYAEVHFEHECRKDICPLWRNEK